MDEEMKLVDLEFYTRKRDFIEHKRKQGEFIIMYRTYYGYNPSDEEIHTYSREVSGIDFDIDENEDEYEEDYDD